MDLGQAFGRDLALNQKLHVGSELPALDLDAADEAWRWIQAARPTDAPQAYLRDLETARIAQARNDYVVAAHVLMHVSLEHASRVNRLAEQQLNDQIWVIPFMFS